MTEPLPHPTSPGVKDMLAFAVPEKMAKDVAEMPAKQLAELWLTNALLAAINSRSKGHFWQLQAAMCQEITRRKIIEDGKLQ